MLWSLRKNGLTSLFKEVRVFKGGVENSGEGKTYQKTPPPKRFWTPPTYDVFSPLCPCSVIWTLSNRGNGHRQDQSHFLRPLKVVLEGARYRMLPPNKSQARFYPPVCRCPTARDWTSESLKGRSLQCKFGCEASKFRSEFCCGFWGGFYPPAFFQGKGPPNPPTNAPRSSEKFPLDFCNMLGQCATICDNCIPGMLRHILLFMLHLAACFCICASLEDSATCQQCAN